MERHKFHTRGQKQGESIQSFISDLRIMAKCFHVRDLTENLICDRIVWGVTSDTLRKALSRDSELKLPKAISICQKHEMTEESGKTLAYKSNDASVNAIKFQIGCSDQSPSLSQDAIIVEAATQLSRKSVQHSDNSVTVAKSLTTLKVAASLNRAAKIGNIIDRTLADRLSMR